ncbi:TetR/AcrR family transcriptional regulator [Microbispora corallina]|uniref:TetR family transcriptional regulator n=1 Tax=Microbispora corallina TaxID=83302 RepID=A0ABQ4FXB3_9ACTN|nr:TetR/AcrR family transcriptional regulator [Microbispora corallina]GIH39462.1 TetR family transcriptional regulator [Microbispora corallina]
MSTRGERTERTERGERGRRGDTRQRLYRAAVDLIAEQGYTATTVDAIAERAGVAKGTVFYNFGSKEALFAGLLDHGIERLADALAEAARAPSASPVATLDALVLAQLRFVDEYGPFARVLLAEMWRAAWQEAVLRLRTSVLGVYERVLEEAVRAGELREGLDTATAATAVFGMVLTVAIERRALRPDHPLDDVHATLVELIHGRISGR